jgi:hypothetical protein
MASLLILVIGSGAGTLETPRMARANTPCGYSSRESLWMGNNSAEIQTITKRLERLQRAFPQEEFKRILATAGYMKYYRLYLKRRGLGVYQLLRVGARAMRLPELPELRSKVSIESDGNGD